MNNREERKSGVLNTLAMAAIAIAVCTAALLLMPAHAGSEASTNAEVSAAPTTGYVPAQYVNQAKEIEPTPEMYY